LTPRRCSPRTRTVVAYPTFRSCASLGCTRVSSSSSTRRTRQRQGSRGHRPTPPPLPSQAALTDAYHRRLLSTWRAERLSRRSTTAYVSVSTSLLSRWPSTSGQSPGRAGPWSFCAAAHLDPLGQQRGSSQRTRFSLRLDCARLIGAGGALALVLQRDESNRHAPKPATSRGMRASVSRAGRARKRRAPLSDPVARKPAERRAAAAQGVSARGVGRLRARERRRRVIGGHHARKPVSRARGRATTGRLSLGRRTKGL
jgi:hypothetical protein